MQWRIRHTGQVKASARELHRKALSSMRTAMTAFNSPHNDGRSTAVLLHLQHAFEMLLKAALVQGGVKVFDKDTERSIGFESAVRQAQQLPGVKVKDTEAGTLRAIDAPRRRAALVHRGSGGDALSPRPGGRHSVRRLASPRLQAAPR
jgi:hypothetical protein